MLRKDDIQNNHLVYDTDDEIFYSISDVGNAVEMGYRGSTTIESDELSYSIKNIITGEIREGICENSGMTNCLELVSIGDVDAHLAMEDANATLQLGNAKMKYAEVLSAVNRFKKKYKHYV